mmetsp:Transcript_28088/g.39493  ORF Transcript_28088/g.39493 Transcript_28088/m.39493 type:complete len:257 (-) Transcript_28088:192-962(-)
MKAAIYFLSASVATSSAFSPASFAKTTTTTSLAATTTNTNGEDSTSVASRRSFLSTSAATAAATIAFGLATPPQPAEAVGPVRVDLTNPKYSAAPCPKDRPIPGEKAMKGMRGLCVTVEADLKENSPKELDKVGVYGFVKDGNTGDSVLANNPDLSTDAGQFAIIEKVTTTDKKVIFDFVAAVPVEKDVSKYDNGIGPLDFESLRIISYPGGQQYGAINPCEMNEFSDECEAWENENGPYEKADYMVKSNPRTKGR